ncbi:MAG: hypothetical protein PUC12_08635 [Clostridiales bacterium]|nr:hypothetical protein [Clostridiales bacterium]
MEDLKDYRKKEIPILLLGNILVLLYMLEVFDTSMISIENENWLGTIILSILNSTV